MFRRYILFANFIPLALLLALILLFVPAEEQFFLVFTASVASAGWAALIAALSGFFSIPVLVRRLFDKEGAKSDFGRKTVIDPSEADESKGPSQETRGPLS